MVLSKMILSILLLLGGVFSTSTLKEHRVKTILKPLKLTTTKATPPRLAFMQVLDFEQRSAKAIISVEAEPHFKVNLNEVIQKRQLRPLSFVLNRRQVSLPAILITRAEVYHRKVVGNEVPASVVQQFHQPVRTNPEWPETLTEREKNWLHQSSLSQDDFKVFNEPAVDPVAVRLQNSINKEMARPADSAFPGWIISQPTGPTTGSGPVAEATDPQEPDRKSFAKSSNHTVEGLLLLGMGVILGAQEHIEIHWSKEGTRKVSGKLLTDGNFRYQIQIPELAGSVSAEIYDALGQLKAKGVLRLADNRKSGDIVIHSQRTLASQHTNFYDSPSKLMDFVRFRKPKGSKGPVIQAKVSVDAEAEFQADENQRLLVDGVFPGSTAFGFARSKGYYPSLHWMTTGALRPFPLVPESTAKAMLDLARSANSDAFSSIRTESLILGQVVRDGKPISGVAVTLEDGSGRRPVYLNALLIPDVALKETSSNGYFVFADLEKGYHSFRAEKGNFFFGFGNVLAEEQSMSYVEIEEAGQMAPFDIRSFDAFTGEEISAEVTLQGLGSPVVIDGYASIPHPVTNHIELTQAKPVSPAYVDSIFVSKGDDDHIHLPLVPKAWLDKTLATSSLSAQPGQGLLIGFVSKAAYQVVFPHLSEEAPVTVIFFDSNGNRVESPVENGGFIALNVPASAHTVVVRDNFGETSSQIVPIDPDRVTTLRFLF